MRCLRTLSNVVLAVSALMLAGCATQGPQAPEQPVLQVLPPAFPPQDIVGRWGLAAFHKAEDQARTEEAARNQCRQPYIITLGPTGGVMMHLADQAQAEELRLKGASGGKTFIGPDGEVGGVSDREVMSFNGRVLVLRWMDPEVQGRYGTMVYVRCGPEGEKRLPPKPKRKAKPKLKPKPKPAAAPLAPGPAQSRPSAPAAAPKQ
jgi:hypothetical protein